MNPATDTSRRLIWDLPVRIFHWSLAASFAGAWITAESERWQMAHILFGYTLLALIAFRLIWGVIGSRTARFAEFVRGPRAVLAYLGSLLRGQPAHHEGHNPAGAVAIVLLLALAAAAALSGIATFNEIGGDAMEDVHEGLANAMMAVVVVHLIGVLIGSLAHRENLVRTMISGYRTGTRDDGIASPRRGIAALLVAGLAALWWWIATAPESVPGLSTITLAQAERGDHDNHDEEDD